MKRTFSIKRVDPEGPEDWFDWEDLFDVCGIRIAHYQDLAYVALDADGYLVGALIGGPPQGDAAEGMWFSVVVEEEWRRVGVAAALITLYTREYNQAGVEVCAHVVNRRAVEPLLEGLGFSSDYGGVVWRSEP